MKDKRKLRKTKMDAITRSDCLDFIQKKRTIIIEDTSLPLGQEWEINELQPKDFELETNTVWSFPQRGKWATHYLNAKYRGNWAPQVPRNLILRYSEPGETVLDAFVGSGTTLIECRLTGRNGIGIDINREAAILAQDRLNFRTPNGELLATSQKIFVGDACALDKLKDNSIDLIVTHPPYASIISYTKNSADKNDGDLSKIYSTEKFQEKMAEAAKEFYRVLKPEKYCCLLIGDTRRHKHQIPISHQTLDTFLANGFILKENIIKIQHNTKTAPLWKNLSIKNNFLLLAHENLFVFRKLAGR